MTQIGVNYWPVSYISSYLKQYTYVLSWWIVPSQIVLDKHKAW